MSQSLPFVSFVVPTRNRAALLRGCLESLVAQDYPPASFEIIVADDDSTDGTGATVEAFSGATLAPPVRHLKLGRVGVNGARNAGIQNARGEFVCVVDDDELVQAGHLRMVAHHFREENGLDAVGGPYRAYGRPRFPTCRRCVPGDSDFPGQGVRKVRSLHGGNMAIRKSLFERRGLFDPELSGLADEYEWFQRQPPLDLLYDPELWVWHRRDQQGLGTLCRAAWTQGLGAPLAGAKLGGKYHPSFLKLLRYSGHGLVRWCGSGLILACREAGALAGARRLKRQARKRHRSLPSNDGTET